MGPQGWRKQSWNFEALWHPISNSLVWMRLAESRLVFWVVVRGDQNIHQEFHHNILKESIWSSPANPPLNIIEETISWTRRESNFTFGSISFEDFSWATAFLEYCFRTNSFKHSFLKLGEGPVVQDTCNVWGSEEVGFSNLDSLSPRSAWNSIYRFTERVLVLLHIASENVALVQFWKWKCFWLFLFLFMINKYCEPNEEADFYTILYFFLRWMIGKLEVLIICSYYMVKSSSWVQLL